MCLGFPMTILSGDDAQALCVRRGETQSVSMLLLGAQAPGTSVLVHLGTAMRVLESQEAQAIDDAIDGLAAASRGESFERYFADLVDREPELPEFLRDRS